MLEDRAALVARYGGEPAERHPEQPVVARDPGVAAGFLCVSALACRVVNEDSQSRNERT